MCFFRTSLASDQQRPLALQEVKKRFDIQLLSAAISVDCFGWKNGAFNRDAMSVIEKLPCSALSRPGGDRLLEQQNGDDPSLGIEVSLFDFMERNATKEERDAGYDIADFLLREETKEAILNRLITLNPALKTLVETFDLQLVNVEKAPLSATVPHTWKGLQTMTFRCPHLLLFRR